MGNRHIDAQGLSIGERRIKQVGYCTLGRIRLGVTLVPIFFVEELLCLVQEGETGEASVELGLFVVKGRHTALVADHILKFSTLLILLNRIATF